MTKSPQGAGTEASKQGSKQVTRCRQSLYHDSKPYPLSRKKVSSESLPLPPGKDTTISPPNRYPLLYAGKGYHDLQMDLTLYVDDTRIIAHLLLYVEPAEETTEKQKTGDEYSFFAVRRTHA